MSERKFLVIVWLAIVALFIWAVYPWPPQPRAAGEANYGYQHDAEGAARFALEVGTFRQVGAEAIERSGTKDVFLYRYVVDAHRKVYGREWECWDQGDAGTCVSMAFGLGSYTAQCVDYGEHRMPEPPPSVATEPIYGGARTVGVGRNSGGNFDGATGFGAARWLSGNCPNRPEIGGVLYRQRYGAVDLSTYSIPLSRQWGRSGVPDDLAREAYKTRTTAVANVKTWEELVASLERGSPVVLASSVGYGRLDGRPPVRDQDGFLDRGKPWGHAMLVWAVRHDREGGLIQNSWSKDWCSGPKWPEDQPDGSFWAEKDDIVAALEQGDCWAVGGIDGFAWRELDHRSWMQPKGDR